MYMNLLCPKCGFAFGVGFPDDEPEENVTEIMTCPCGSMMEQVDSLYEVIMECDDG